MALHYALDPNQRLDLGVESVAHELEFAVWRDEADGPVVFESRQSHALVELDVLHLDCLSACCPAGGLEHDLVVEAQAQFGHAGQVALHLDRAQNLRPQHVAVGGDEQVERLDDVEEDLVLAVADALATPADCVGDGDGRPCLDLELVRLLRYVFLQYLGLGGLRVAEVHHLVQQLVDDDKVVADALLLELLEVLGEDLDDLVQEQQDLGGVGVALGEGEQVQVVVADVEVVDALVGEARRHGGAVFFGLAEQHGELLDGGHGDVAAVVARQKGLQAAVSTELPPGTPRAHLALEVEEEDGRRHCGESRGVCVGGDSRASTALCVGWDQICGGGVVVSRAGLSSWRCQISVHVAPARRRR
jgi:hypothetical protein